MTNPLAPDAVVEAMARATANRDFTSWEQCMGKGHYIDLLDAALSTAQEMGWVLTPVEPTQIQLFEAHRSQGEATFEAIRLIYAAMLSARNKE